MSFRTLLAVALVTSPFLIAAVPRPQETQRYEGNTVQSYVTTDSEGPVAAWPAQNPACYPVEGEPGPEGNPCTRALANPTPNTDVTSTTDPLPSPTSTLSSETSSMSSVESSITSSLSSETSSMSSVESSITSSLSSIESSISSESSVFSINPLPTVDTEVSTTVIETSTSEVVALPTTTTPDTTTTEETTTTAEIPTTTTEETTTTAETTTAADTTTTADTTATDTATATDTLTATDTATDTATVIPAVSPAVLNALYYE